LSSASQEQQKVVVIVDDEYDQVQGLELALKDHGYAVFYGEDGDKGLALVNSVKPDLLVLDLSMPGRSGFLVLEYMRTNGSVDCPVIVVTAIEGQRHRDYAMTLGARVFLKKPYGIYEMLDSIKRLIG
jgi:DNA-binding response OmpR family regulator